MPAKALGLVPFTPEDVDILMPIMARAFDRDTQRHLGEPAGGPDGYDDGSFLRRYGLHPQADALKVTLDGQPVGGVILWITPQRVNTLGCMFIDPDVQDQGIGARVWMRVEARYPDTRVWRTETPGFSRHNHAFYVNRCGFHIVRIDDPKDWREAQYRMEKVMR